MVDFWEVFGRMSTDDTFRGKLYAACQATPYPTTLDGTQLRNTALAIPQAAYDTARKIVATVVQDGPVSLMTLGELLTILSSQTFRSLADELSQEIAATGVNVAGRSKLFYTALGCMLLDGTILLAFRNQLFDQNDFGGLTAAERADLGTLADPNGPVKMAANLACQTFWDLGCFDDFNYYAADGLRPGHTHPLAQPLPTN